MREIGDPVFGGYTKRPRKPFSYNGLEGGQSELP